MKITVTVEFTAADRRILADRWGRKRLPTKAELIKWVRNLPQTTLADYRYPEDEE